MTLTHKYTTLTTMLWRSVHRVVMSLKKGSFLNEHQKEVFQEGLAIQNILE